jgi:hypothetical protein
MRNTPSWAVLAKADTCSTIFAWLYERDAGVFKGAPNGGKDSPPRLTCVLLEAPDRAGAHSG